MDFIKRYGRYEFKEVLVLSTGGIALSEYLITKTREAVLPNLDEELKEARWDGKVRVREGHYQVTLTIYKSLAQCPICFHSFYVDESSFQEIHHEDLLAALKPGERVPVGLCPRCCAISYPYDAQPLSC